MKIIDNAEMLLETMHEKRLKDVQYGEGFIVVPKFVYFPFSKWYKVTKIIERKVITYRTDKKKALNAFKNRKNSMGASMIVTGT